MDPVLYLLYFFCLMPENLCTFRKHFTNLLKISRFKELYKIISTCQSPIYEVWQVYVELIRQALASFVEEDASRTFFNGLRA